MSEIKVYTPTAYSPMWSIDHKEGKVMFEEKFVLLKDHDSAIAALNEKLEKALRALEFYGDICNWTSKDNVNFKTITEVDCEFGLFFLSENKSADDKSDVFGGKLARQTLKQLEQE